MLALALCCAALTAVLPLRDAFVALALAVTALTVAAVLSARAQFLAMQAEGLPAEPAGDADTDPGAVLRGRLRRQREEHLARVDAALDEGRPDLARELTDGYTDAALRLLTEDADAPVG